ncbi:hypothetical protein GOARA_033_00230 [Gordonia araii NBRC 100433]|uniref:ESAT-6-like protein n=1 Tax=Gordonia araii NBRC 100433 TaxID=1073574 RepID=G7H047_9ACTN|nr:hypothetical protein [Gordonia araii]NNG99046.1 hypothetical protein [Gordonia araii NBRC 100433]GAB09222.1 hypothetical protein GOARA_033_00230 [Gordonia araii NBRC 100433]
MVTRVDFEALRAGTEQLEEVRDEVQQITSRLQGRLAAEGQSWGSDTPGSTHAAGYTDQDQKTMDAVENRITTLNQYVDGLTEGLQKFVGTEDTNTSRYQV